MANWRISDIRFPEEARIAKQLQGVAGAAAPGSTEAHALLLGLLVAVGQLEIQVAALNARLDGTVEKVQRDLAEDVDLRGLLRKLFPEE